MAWPLRPEVTDLSPYARFAGVVVHGDKRGRALGFPTANICLPAATAFPADGVYCCLVRLPPDERLYGATVSVGKNPTFPDVETTRMEAYIHDLDTMLYGRELEVFLVRPVRDMQRFASVAELIAQTERDVGTSRRWLRPLLDA